MIEEWTQREDRSLRYIARKIGASPGTVLGWMKRGQIPNGEFLIKLAELIGKDPRELLESKESPDAA